MGTVQVLVQLCGREGPEETDFIFGEVCPILEGFGRMMGAFCSPGKRRAGNGVSHPLVVLRQQ